MILEYRSRKRSEEFYYVVPDTVAGCVEAWGEEAVHEMIRAEVQRRAKKVIDQMIAEGATNEWIQNRMREWQPVDGKRTRDVIAKVLEYVQERFPEPADRAEAMRYVLRKLRVDDEKV